MIGGFEMSFKDIFTAAALLIITGGAIFAAIRVKAAAMRALPPTDSLTFVNNSGKTVSGVYMSGRDGWSENLLAEEPLSAGEERLLRLGGTGLPGSCDMRILFTEGGEELWRRLPIRGILRITARIDGKPSYEEASVCT